MAVGVLLPDIAWQGFDDNGDPLDSGLLYTYVAGTSTPLAVYSDVGLTTPHANPVVLDAAGRKTIYLTPATAHKFILKTSAGVTIKTQDNVTVAAANAVVSKVTVAGGLTKTYTGATDGTGDIAISAGAIAAGAIAIASQAALDFIYAGTAAQLARLAKGAAHQYPRMNATAAGWEFGTPTVSLAATLANVADTVTETTILSFVIPANTMADGDVIRVTLLSLEKNNKGTPETAALKCNVGVGAQVTLAAAAAFADAATEYTTIREMWLQRMGSTVEMGHYTTTSSFLATPGQATSAVLGASTPANFTADQTVSLKVTLSAAHATFYIKPQSARVMHFRG